MTKEYQNGEEEGSFIGRVEEVVKVGEMDEGMLIEFRGSDGLCACLIREENSPAFAKLADVASGVEADCEDEGGN